MARTRTKKAKRVKQDDPHYMFFMRTHESISSLLKAVGAPRNDPDFKREWNLLQELETMMPELKGP